MKVWILTAGKSYEIGDVMVAFGHLPTVDECSGSTRWMSVDAVEVTP